MKAQTRTKLFKYFLSGLGRDDSDTENVEGGMVPAAKLAEVEKKCHDLTKQLKVHYLNRSTHCTKLMLTMDLSQTPFFEFGSYTLPIHFNGKKTLNTRLRK